MSLSVPPETIGTVPKVPYWESIAFRHMFSNSLYKSYVVGRRWAPWAIRNFPVALRWGALASLAIIYVAEPPAITKYFKSG